MKKILGLDLGTNSIGWAVVNAEEKQRDDNTTYLSPIGISSAGSRIIPMDEDTMSKFSSGKTSKNSNVKSQTAQRTFYRGMRRLRERSLLRRERLLRVLNILGFLPEHFSAKIDRYGKFIDDSEPKIAWVKHSDGKQEFLFKDSFNEMLADFAKYHPELIAKDKKVPYDWTIYYLRKKAISKPITKQELAWILLQFNQKRGYYQLRGEGEDEDKKTATIRQYFDRQVITDVIDTGEIFKGLKVLKVTLQNGDSGKIFKKEIPNWVGQEKSIIVTVDIDKDGNDKYNDDGQISRRFKIPTEAEWENEWKLIKLKTEKDIDDSHTTVGSNIYDAILAKPDQKIIGKYVRTIEREYYKKELCQILDLQKNYIAELQNLQFFNDCIEALYPNNEAHRKSISKNGFTKLFVDDILFYQRPLKTKKSLIRDCQYESRFDKQGNKYPIKCIAESNPLFQEFRLWQFIHNLRIYNVEEVNPKSAQLSLYDTRIDVTAKSADLFTYLNDKESVSQNDVLNFFKADKDKYVWNYPPDKKYQGNETRAKILKRLKAAGVSADFLTKDKEYALWHILYSVEDNTEIKTALNKFAIKNGLKEEPFVECLRKCTFEKDYGSYSEKAIKKLLPLMRCGKYWNADNIDPKTKSRIDKIITGEYDDGIKDRVREKAINLTDISHFSGLSQWLACYVVYNRHSEAKDIVKWESPEDIDKYLNKDFKQHYLHNPIVEQVVRETLRTVRDIWKQEGCIDEIHLELGREMKNNAEQRKKISESVQNNENTNLRIKALLMEFQNPKMNIENVRPNSPSQQDILRIYEEYALSSNEKYDQEKDAFVPDVEIPDYVAKVVNGITSSDTKKQPSQNDIIKYKCWLEQRYRSPYTGKMIPLARLFTADYQIEHIIPRARYYDDSFSNKVICEARVNEDKDATLAHKFISAKGGSIVDLGGGNLVKLFTITEYENFVKEHYASNRIKMKKLLMDDIPDDFIERQLNDSRYISKFVKGLLSNIVRAVNANGEYEQEAVSKNLISCNGAITDLLKKDWGMNDVWNSIVLPRFIRLNTITGKTCFTATNTEGHLIPSMPLELQKGFNKKRIDHRHHAMDAIVIACTTRDHVNLLNNESARKKYGEEYRYDLQHKLRRYENTNIKGVEREVPKEFLKPWEAFTTDAKQALENIIVSFKQNLRVINRTENWYQHFDNGKKGFVRQEGKNWAIRKSMHKDTVYGEVNLKLIKDVSLQNAIKVPDMIVDKELKQKVKELLALGNEFKQIKKYFDSEKDVWSEVKSNKIKVYYYTKDDLNENGVPKTRYFATRKPIDTTFNAKKIVECVTDTAIQKILLAHLKANGDNSELAFSPDGIDEMNNNIKELNCKQPHQPIYKVRCYESGEKYQIGQKGNRKTKFVEADKGTNLFFAVFETKVNEESKRTFLSIPLNVMIDCQKQFANDWRSNIENYLKEKNLVSVDARLLFILSPNDLVYLPLNGSSDFDKSRIYKFVSCSGYQCFFVREDVAKSIVDKLEFSKLNKTERALSGEMIKEICVPLKVDRLGNIIKVGI